MEPESECSLVRLSRFWLPFVTFDICVLRVTLIGVQGSLFSEAKMNLFLFSGAST